MTTNPKTRTPTRANAKKIAASVRPPKPRHKRADLRTEDSWQRLCTLALQLPDVEVSTSYNTPALKVKGKFMARLRTEAEGGLAIRCDFVERNMLLQADPEAFFLTDHYLNYPMILIRLEHVRWDAMPAIIEHAYRLTATQRQIQALEASKAKKH